MSDARDSILLLKLYNTVAAALRGGLVTAFLSVGKNPQTKRQKKKVRNKPEMFVARMR